MKKILIIGCSCIGKTTVAEELSSDLGVKAISINEVKKNDWLQFPIRISRLFT